MTVRTARAMARRGALVVAAAGLAVGVAACGTHTVAAGGGNAKRIAPARSAGGASPGAPAGVNPGGVMQGAGGASATCAARSQMTSASITESQEFKGARHSGKHQVMSVRQAPVVQALTSALCALPPLPSRIECPADFGQTVAITLSAGTRRYPQITVGLSGCRKVTGLTPVRYWSKTPSLKQVLDEAMKGH